MKLALPFIAALLILSSCSKKDMGETLVADRVSDYVRFVSADPKSKDGNGYPQVKLNFNVANSREVLEIHIYAKNDVYQLSIPSNDGVQSATDKFIESSTTSRQYYLVVILGTLEKIEGKPFTVSFN